ncbi:BolA family protein [Uliginosibacterium sediminicola]|uniref:BolA family protein n=1 Tax=Uliginosibacterium sediminicola TaxID=2024550 RepID=A0ABU9Z1A2_9RHOO
MSNTADKIRQALSALQPNTLELSDDSHEHAGHAGNRGGGHYSVRVVSSQFEGLSTVARHRLIYTTLGALMKTEIHALAIAAQTPSEASTTA